MFKKFKILWRNFWGSRYWIFEDETLTKELLIYHRKIYVKEIKEEKNNERESGNTKNV